MSELHITPERLIDYLHGELQPQDDAAVHAHVAACPACASAYDEEARLTDLLRRHARETERELPPGVVARIRSAVEEQRPAPWWSRLGFALHPAAVAACIVAGLLVGTYVSLAGFHSHARAATVDAAYYLDDHAALAPTTPFGD
jgi:anti-sigma factor RsiW